ncbi:5-methylcytosine restriction system specificity protein McrC [Niallia sp. FSL W8-0954]|uniref:5-methylcytosine restriction system specificity protein McrC n=1 Tax=Niallia sp. FSL W8-0954 TaxID=2975338 RepID=UPI0030F4ED6F
MGNNFKINQGHSISIFEDEINVLESMLKAKGINPDSLDKEQRILNLSQRYVGYIKTPRRMIELLPKHDKLGMKHIFRMYYFVNGHFNNLQDKVFDLSRSSQYVNIIDLFLNDLDKILRHGLPTEYIEVVEESRYIRGSVDYVPSYKNVMLLKEEPFLSQYDEVSLQTPLNKTLKFALNKVKRIDEYRHKLQKYERALQSISNDYNEQRDSKIVFSNKNNYCKDAYFYAILIIKEYYFENLGDKNGECFLIDFDLLYEQFVKKILFNYTNDTKFQDWKMDKLYGVFGEGYEKSYRPDILYGYDERDEKAMAVLDTKNKFSSVFGNADVYQMLFYAHMLDAKKIVLCYPTVEDKPIDVLRIESNNFITDKIHGVYINIAVEEKEAFVEAINQFIEDVYSCL